MQTGDIVDRGPDSKYIYDIFMKLHQQAPKSGIYLYSQSHNEPPDYSYFFIEIEILCPTVCVLEGGYSHGENKTVRFHNFGKNQIY